MVSYASFNQSTIGYLSHRLCLGQFQTVPLQFLQLLQRSVGMLLKGQLQWINRHVLI